MNDTPDHDTEIVCPVSDGEGGIRGWMIFCPACGCGHLFNTQPGPNGMGGMKPCWTFNGSTEKPSFSPSMLVRGVVPLTDEELDRMAAGEAVTPKPLVCHSFVKDGQIQYLGDCTHALAGKTVPLEPF
jgi:hypothetical protein